MNKYTIKSKYGEPMVAFVRWGQFWDGTPGLWAETEYGPESLSVNLTGFALEAPDGHVYVRNYSEHEGLPEALMEAGVATKVAQVWFGPFGANAWLMEVNADINNTKER